MQCKTGESIQELAARIHQDTAKCDFSSIRDLQDEAMQTRFLCSVNNEVVLKALFKVCDDQLSFSKAIQISLETEDAAKVAKETVYGPTKDSVFEVCDSKKFRSEASWTPSTFKKDFPKVTCPRCGKTNHRSDDGRIKNSQCNFCKKKGHIKKVCLGKKQNLKKRTNQIIVKPKVNNIDSRQRGPLMQPIYFKNRSFMFQVDTGTCDNFCGRDIWSILDLNLAYYVGIRKGIRQPVQFNEWGTPVVPIRKELLPGERKANLSVCGDYSVTVNPQLETHRHPIPLPEDLMCKLGGGYFFSKIDLADAYNQVRLGPENQRRLALSMHQGVLLQTRLPFGISGYYQEIMEKLTKDLKGVAVYLDDILVSGYNAGEHLQNLQYLGHTLSHRGISKRSKVDAVLKMPPPSDVSNLRSVQFYAKFIPDLSTYRPKPLDLGYSLSELLNGRQIRSKLDALIPSPASVAQGKQAKMVASLSRSQFSEKTKIVVASMHWYTVGAPCYAHYCEPRCNKEPRWIPAAVVVKVLGTRSVNVSKEINFRCSADKHNN
ncbi:hypothetical protein J437_LFUL007445 [Ladona fulva]|uniref:Reverse transcriptase domain-containing protein n=1 Tax=Ladona fulva TaxID=123851 RepID=A0A8K0KCN8_LADFU|nr:hypothetical protein J437_LFUL007445 [Ladona fulva]